MGVEMASGFAPTTHVVLLLLLKCLFTAVFVHR